MARDPSLLDSTQPSTIAPATPAIAHVQLRDLLICPREQGVLNYIVPRGIVEQDMNTSKAPVRVLSNLTFTPNSLTSLQVGNDTLLAAGGQETEIHLSYHTPSSTSSLHRTRLVWEFEDSLTGSINNSVLLTSLSLTRSNESSVDPRVGISNNDGSVRFYDIPLRVTGSSRRKLRQVGQVKLDVPINHSSISPDGRTLLSVGDSNKVYIHQITGGASISFAPITTLTIPPPDSSPLPYASSSLAAAFSTAFSGDGTKFAVASQEGVVAVWDVRSTKPVKVFQTDKTRGMGGGNGAGGGLLGNGGASGWLSDDPFEWTRGTKAPGWCVRSVKFNGGEGARLGKEVMAFTEHTSLVHLVDARTFETHDIIRVPALQRQESSSSPPRRAPSSNASTSTRRPTSTSSRSLLRRLLPVSNARRSGLPPSSSPTRSGTGASARPARTCFWGRARAVKPVECGECGGIVVVPDLGDRDVESEVHALLAVHGIQSRLGGGRDPPSRRSAGPGSAHQNLLADADGRDDDDRQEEGYDERDDDRMRVDEDGDDIREEEARDEDQDDDEELEFECASRGSNSRSGSPFASSSSIRGPSGAASADPLALSPSPSSYAKHPAIRGVGDMKYAYYEDLDIAGLCFDPWGERMYVAGGVGVGAVVEWSVRGAEKRWWVDDGWM
ncbi:WD40-repeat-containing domain protein [Pholiota molesta]|nr:WD40-repeat-containing domain protein [Pholiota molesta]